MKKALCITPTDRIPAPAVRGAWIYNFWQDKDHVRGIWRRASLAEYVKESPAWETVLDLEKQYGIEIEDWRPDISLGEIAELAAARKSTKQDGKSQ